MKTINVFSEDKKLSSSRLRNKDSNNEVINAFYSLAYLTPNYFTMFNLESIKNFLQNKNVKLYLVLWDMNVLAHPYIEKEILSSKVLDLDVFLQRKIDELTKILISIGFKQEDIYIYKSTDIWKRMVEYKSENLFQNFYTCMSKIDLKEFLYTKKVSNTLQIPLDMFFCNYLHNLFPEDISAPIDITFLDQPKLKIYNLTREEMFSRGYINLRRPIFLIIKHMPYFIYESILPEWNMSINEIENILNSLSPKEEDLYLLINLLGSNSIRDIKKLNLDKIDLINLSSKSIFNYLKRFRDMFENVNNDNNKIMNIQGIANIKSLGQIFKSDISLNILRFSDGTLNTTQIAKKLGKSVPTISSYTRDLKEKGLIELDDNNKLKRTMKGVKINFDFSIK